MRLITPAETMLGHLGSLSVYKDVALELRDNSPRINHLPQSAWHRIFASIRHVFGITTREERALAELVVRAVTHLPTYTTRESAQGIWAWVDIEERILTTATRVLKSLGAGKSCKELPSKETLIATRNFKAAAIKLDSTESARRSCGLDRPRDVAVIPFVRNFDTIARFDQRSIKEALKTPIDLQRVMQKLTQLEKLYALLQKHKLKDQDDWKAILHTKIKPSADGFNADNIRDLIQILEELGPGHPMFEASLRQLERNLLSKR